MMGKPGIINLSNNILIISIIIALTFMFLLSKQNAKLQRQNAELKEQLQPWLGTLIGTPAAEVGDIVPSFEAVNLDGNRSRIVYGGTSRYLLYIFSPQCEICISQVPVWKQITTRAQAKNYTALGVSTDPDTTKASLNGSNPNFEILLVPDKSIQRAYRVVAVPVVLLVSAEGKIEWIRYGELTENSVREISSLIDSGAGL
jgi:peroxiredoxin